MNVKTQQITVNDEYSSSLSYNKIEIVSDKKAVMQNVVHIKQLDETICRCERCLNSLEKQ